MFSLFNFFSRVDSFFWANIAFILIVSLGVFMTVRMGFFQLTSVPGALRLFWSFIISGSKEKKGVHPLKAFFASVGGMIGIGNIVGVVTALQIGGPGALFWLWLTAFLGSIIKYSEIYLGIKYRVPNSRGGYDGGPIYFLKAAFKGMWAPTLVAVLLCIYGVEIYQFTVLTDCLSSNWSLNRPLVMLVLLTLILFASVGGVKRIGRIGVYVMPVFVIIYIVMSLYVIISNAALLPAIFLSVFKTAFTGHSAVGGFVGSSIFLAIQHGMARAAYSADIGIGYDSIIQSESSVTHSEKQASISVIGVFIDSFICTMSILMVLISGLWTASPQLATSDLVQNTLSLYFPYMKVFLPLFLLVTGFTTIIAYMCVGLKCARFLSPKYGERIYVLYGIFAFIYFSYFDPSVPLLVMSIAGALLLIINLLGIFRLRDEVKSPSFVYDM
ncbi:MAG: sodium/alanine symporter protein [Chlamydiae bacterium RIFCSPHIGHO2_12_FULL_49_11]|nr:MAG: sodium/alanine symporter protein [Chlamydiae bacterium RIFCSPHIGHO2_12_FULL_49_11]